tara:strand:- start:708 stop:1214 length:507 start_codon:yes stop_codon:yes gene_type:complete
MKNIFKNNILARAILFVSLLTLAVSCDEHEDLDVGTTALVEASGDWYVEFLIDGVDVYGLGYNLLTTSNSADETSIWIDDHANIWQFKAKCPIDIESLKFDGSDLESSVDGYDVTLQITNGTIIKDGATSTGGNVVDSIYFEAEFSDDPGTIYQFAGYKRTGLAEDEH